MDYEYLLSYGTNGDFGRFRPVQPLLCQRGSRAVVRSHRGLEIGVVLCEATEGHAHFLPDSSRGELLRLTTPEDEAHAEQMRRRAAQLFEHARQLAAELNLPLEILDIEVLLDGQHAIIHHLRLAECDERPLVSSLSREHDLYITLHNLAFPKAPSAPGCGRPDCGQAAGGGCSTCGSGGGCATCGAAAAKDMKVYFARLREQMMQHRRTTLL